MQATKYNIFSMDTETSHSRMAILLIVTGRHFLSLERQ